MLIEPTSKTEVRAQVDQNRAEWYRNNWRIPPAVANAYDPATAEAGTVHAIQLDIASVIEKKGTANGVKHVVVKPVAVTIAPGIGSRITLAITTNGPTVEPKIKITPPTSKTQGANPLSVAAWAGQWRFDLTRPHDTQLNLRDDRLLADLNRLPISADRPRRYELWLSASQSTKPGTYQGTFTVELNGQKFDVPLIADVLPVRPPPAEKPVGPYLGYAPHLQWFSNGEPAGGPASELRSTDISIARPHRHCPAGPSSPARWHRNL